MEFVTAIERLAREKTCFVGMGNYFKRDDAVGLYIVDGIRDRLGAGPVTALNVEDVIENYVFSIARGEADNVVIVDAVQAGGEEGSVIFTSLDEFNEMNGNYSTHKMALFLSGKVLAEHKKKTWLLGVEVCDIDFGEGLSDKVKQSADYLRDILLSYINCDQKELVYEH